MNQHIVAAIQGARVLRVRYDGGERLIEPHCYGRGSQGQELLRCFQASGHSNSGQPFAWKLFRVGEMQVVELTDEVFETPRTDYNPDDKVMKGGIFARLPASAVTRAWK
jgi:hypothetical protein